MVSSHHKLSNGHYSLNCLNKREDYYDQTDTSEDRMVRLMLIQ